MKIYHGDGPLVVHIRTEVLLRLEGSPCLHKVLRGTSDVSGGYTCSGSCLDEGESAAKRLISEENQTRDDGNLGADRRRLSHLLPSFPMLEEYLLREKDRS